MSFASMAASLIGTACSSRKELAWAMALTELAGCKSG